MRHQFKKNPPVDVETNVLGRTALPWRFRNPKIVGGCFQLRFSSQDVDMAPTEAAEETTETDEEDKKPSADDSDSEGHA